MPSSGAVSTTRRTASTPARCPAVRGKPRRVAQRPLPSMMIATCRPRLAGMVLVMADASRMSQLAKGARAGLGAGGIAHHLLEHSEIVEIPPASLGRDTAEG